MRLIDKVRNRVVERVAATEVLTSWGSIAPASTMLDFRTTVEQGYRANGVVYAVMLARAALVQEAEFAFEDHAGVVDRNDSALDLLKRPWPGGSTRDLLARMETDSSINGNAFIVKVASDELLRLQPDRVGILSDGRSVSGYLYSPSGTHNTSGWTFTETKPIDTRDLGATWLIRTEQMAHYPGLMPDPLGSFRGTPWLQSVAQEVDADTEMTRHKRKFLENAATPNLVIKIEKALDKKSRELLKDELAARYEGVDGAYRTMILDQGADVMVAGATFRQMTFTATQGAGETRIAAAAGVPPVIVGLSEGLQAATYSNYQLAMRRFADLTARPIWGAITETLAPLIEVPTAQRLVYDDTRIPALQQDAKDDAEIVALKARTMDTLIRAGYKPEDVAAAVDASDLTTLVHSGALPTTLYPDVDEGS